jgi:hypothetical protein
VLWPPLRHAALPPQAPLAPLLIPSTRIHFVYPSTPLLSSTPPLSSTEKSAEPSCHSSAMAA